MKRQDALRILGVWLAAASVKRSLERLREFQERGKLLNLYRHFFPREFNRSTASIELANTPYSPREWEFLQLVHARLFPLNLWWLELVAEEPDAERLTCIPVDTVSLWDWDFYLHDDDVPLAVRVLVALLFGEQEEGDWDALLARVPGAPRPVTGSYYGEFEFDTARFERLCRRAGGLMAAVPLALRVVDHCTGNFWLDVPEFEGQQICLEWDVETMTGLAKLWREAQPLLEKWERVIDWLDADPARLGKVIELWNRTCTLKPRFAD